MNLQSFTTRLFSHRKWPFYLVGIIILLSQFFTAAMNIINSLIWWRRIDLELILIGCIDSFAVALLIAPVAIYLVRHSFNLEEMNWNLQKEVAERTKAEEALRKSEERYRTILEKIEDGYHELDLKGNFTFFNESFRKILGYTKEDLLGMNFRRYSDQENAQKVFKAYNQVYRTGKPLNRFSWEIIRNDGSRRHIVVSVSLIKDPSDKPTGFRGIVRDETNRREAEEALIRSEKKYRDIFDNAVEGIYQAT
ncbi:MAG: PAS domain S-box protein, partial [Syntrophales bacterium LBB04]|nr:PAS domain S-box protein [Syntrophales bacterium LBB04]